MTNKVVGGLRILDLWVNTISFKFAYLFWLLCILSSSSLCVLSYFLLGKYFILVYCRLKGVDLYGCVVECRNHFHQ
jgi:hypothetical protein